MIFRPMLASPIEDTSTLKFPVLASIKLDGIRATVQGGQLLSRNLKPIPNKKVQEKFKNLPEGLDGELIYGDPSDEQAFSNTTSVVMSHDEPADNISFHVFDWFKPHGLLLGFRERLTEVWHERNSLDIIFVRHTPIENEEQLLEFEKTALEVGHEGIMIRSLDGPYKQGRSSLKQGHLLKLKRFKDAEAEITGFAEEQENTNAPTKNKLGHTERSSKKEGMVGKGTLGKFEVIGINGQYKDIEFSIGGGFTALMRQEYWKNREKLIGKIVKYKYFPTGSVGKPRFPVFKGFRDKRDL